MAADTPRRYPAMARHRWALGSMSVKCDLADALTARDRFGGRVDRSFVVPYIDGGERLGPWVEMLPHLDPPPGGGRWDPDEPLLPARVRDRIGPPANLRELPTPPELEVPTHGQEGC